MQCVSFHLEFQIDLRTLVPLVPWHHLGLAFQWVFQSSLSTESPYLAHHGSIYHLSVVSTRDAIAAQQSPLRGSSVCLSRATVTQAVCQPDCLAPLPVHSRKVLGSPQWTWKLTCLLISTPAMLKCLMWLTPRYSQGCGPLLGSFLIFMASCLLSPYVIFISIPNLWWTLWPERRGHLAFSRASRLGLEEMRQ